MNDNDYQANMAYELGKMDAFNEMQGSRLANEKLRDELNAKWNQSYEKTINIRNEWQKKIDEENRKMLNGR